MLPDQLMRFRTGFATHAMHILSGWDGKLQVGGKLETTSGAFFWQPWVCRDMIQLLRF